MKQTVFRCPIQCPWNHRCFVCKIEGEITDNLIVQHKCKITKRDIPVPLLIK